MKRREALIWLGGVTVLAAGKEMAMAGEQAHSGARIELPEVPRGESGGIEDLLHRRRSVRRFAPGALQLGSVGRLLFAAQGINRPRGFRTAPSAGALYPLTVHIAAGAVQGMEPGVYRYLPDGHVLSRVALGDVRREVADAALGQLWMAGAQVILVISAEYAKVTGKYGRRGEQYTHIEAGCAAQNVALQALDLGLGGTVVGAFKESLMQDVLRTPPELVPLIAMPIGRLPG